MEVIVDKKFNGPPGYGHGGYVCGLLARYIDGPAEVSLFKPIPLGKSLSLEKDTDEQVVLRDGTATIAEARPAVVDLEAPERPAQEDVEAARPSYVGLQDGNLFATCFVCGPAHPEGFRLFPALVGNSGLVASMWTPGDSLAGPGGLVDPVFLWAVLDCPGAWALFGRSPRLVLLARLAVDLRAGIRPGETCLALGWAIGDEGRKHYVGTALYGPGDRLLGVAKALWIEPKGELY